MCGIAGLLDSCLQDADALTAAVRAMTTRIAHRGPDGDGVWVDAAAGLALGHRRLAIIDLTEHGRQPMLSQDGRWALSYNGEIYNYREIATELKAAGIALNGHSDTEVLLEACARWGVMETLGKVAGMFAFALWDRKERRLFLARDRLGIKPLYWAKLGQRIVWASELSAIAQSAPASLDIDQDAIAGLFRFGYIPAPLSIWRQARKLAAGSVRVFDVAGESEPQIYWRLSDAVHEGREHVITDPSEGDAALDSLLRTVVSQHMISDVRLGAFLSGGIDSSLVTAVMQATSDRPVHSFSIGFDTPDFDEAPYARAIAHHLGTNHTEFYVNERQALDVVQMLGAMFDEPFADSSQIPTYLVSRLAREHVTVALSGDGGDEVFAGYSRYPQYAGLQHRLRRLGRRTRLLRGLVGPVAHFADYIGQDRAAFRLERLRHYAWQYDGENLYRDMISLSVSTHMGRAADARLRKHWPDTALFAGDDLSHERMQYIDSLTYLPDDILTKVDRTSMAVSLETRVPLLDHRIVELGWRLAPPLKHQNDRGKLALHRLLERYVPRSLFERPKMGFGVPLGAWLRGPLRDWAETLLRETDLESLGVAGSAFPKRHWDSVLAGRGTHVNTYWTLLMLCAWAQANKQASAALPRAANRRASHAP